MDSKQSADILMKMLKERSLNSEEKEAILKAIGILGWTMLSENRMRNRKPKSEN